MYNIFFLSKLSKNRFSYLVKVKKATMKRRRREGGNEEISNSTGGSWLSKGKKEVVD